MSATVFDQAERYLAMRSDTLGPRLAVLTELDGEDTLSKPFSYRIRFTTEEPAADVRGLLGTAVSLEFGVPNAEDEAQARRPLHGMIRRLSRIGRVPLSVQGMIWEAEVVPRLWFLSLTSDFRIFQDMTIPDIVTAVLNDHGLGGRFVLRPAAMAAGHGTLEYCVQYNETALDFVSRLMEQAGLFYWHEHGANEHMLVISDDNHYARVPAPSFGTLAIHGPGWLTRFDEHHTLRSGTWTVRDFNLLDPENPIDRSAEWRDDAGAPGSVAALMRGRERYGYPGRYMARMHASSVDFGGTQSLVGSTDATTMSNLLIESEEANWHRWNGEGLATGLDAGTRVSIDTDMGSGKDEMDFLVTSVAHRVADYSHWTEEMWEGRQPVPRSCTTRFECLDVAVPFRPVLATPRPSVHGPQTAIVTGPPGEEIYTDKYGRVQLKFPWDRAAAPNGTACWVRVSEGWAGNGWGQVHLPRVGDEVVVDFLNGDPDRPIVTGRVYNVERMPPYALPSEKTKSGIRTRSSPGGTSDNASELTFDDAIGSELVLLHAEKDYTVEVENNETRTVGIGSKTGNRTTTIKNDESVTIGGDKSVSLTGNFTETIGGTETRTVTGDVTETARGNVSIKVNGTLDINSDASINLTAPTVNSNSENDSDFSRTYDWSMGVGCGSCFLTANYTGVLNTNSFAVALNTIGLSVTVGLLAVNLVPVTVSVGAVNWSNSSISGEKRLVRMESDIASLRDASIDIIDATLMLMK